MTEQTIRLLMPQWQGAELLAWLASNSDQPLISLVLFCIERISTT